MSSTVRAANGASARSLAADDQPQSYFQQQRAILVDDIAQNLDTFLTQLNRLNRSLESLIAVGNEFSSVEALWSQFENVMGDKNEGTETGESNVQAAEEQVSGEVGAEVGVEN